MATIRISAFTTLAADMAALLFPRLCAGCGDGLRIGEEAICTACRLELAPSFDFAAPAENPSARVFWGRIPVQAAASGYVFGSHGRIQEIIHQLKYKGRRDAGVELGKTIARQMAAVHPFNTVSLIVPVPLHSSRLRQRGYNQAAAFGQGIAELLGVPLRENILLRLQATRTQTRKTRDERWQNVDSVFSVSDPASIENKHILLVDDVLTTGATLESAARPLLAVHGVTVSIVTIAAARN
jgi:ComF family protein